MTGTSTADPKKVAPGVWGGVSIRLQITDAGADLELDCAHGTIPESIHLDGDGRFEVAGAFVREHPGPIRPGHEPASRPASYTGSVRDQDMTLQITLTDSGETVGTYALTHGSEGKVRKCR